MSLEKFDLLISNRISDKQISELVLEAETDPILKAAIEGYVTEHILESNKEITPQVELLTKPLSYHRQINQGTPAPVSSPPPGAGANRVLQLMVAVAGSALAIYFFFINPFWQDNKSPAIASNQSSIIDTGLILHQSELPVDTQTNSPTAPVQHKKIKKSVKEPKFNPPLLIQRFAKSDSVIAAIPSNLFDPILKDLLSTTELEDFNAANLINVNEDYNTKALSTNNSKLNKTNIKDASGKYLPLLVIKDKEAMLAELIKKYASTSSVVVVKESMTYQIAPSHNDVVVLTGAAKTTSSQFLSYKFLFLVNTENGNSTILYYHFGN